MEAAQVPTTPPDREGRLRLEASHGKELAKTAAEQGRRRPRPVPRAKGATKGARPALNLGGTTKRFPLSSQDWGRERFSIWFADGGILWTQTFLI